MSDQCAALLTALQRRPMTTREIEAELAIGRPAAVVHKLKKRGHSIITDMVRVKNRLGEYCTVAQYCLTNGTRAA